MPLQFVQELIFAVHQYLKLILFLHRFCQNQMMPYFELIFCKLEFLQHQLYELLQRMALLHVRCQESKTQLILEPLKVSMILKQGLNFSDDKVIELIPFSIPDTTPTLSSNNLTDEPILELSEYASMYNENPNASEISTMF